MLATPWGFYFLPEFQLILNLIDDRGETFIAPEVGYMLQPGRVVYVKPGWGVNPNRLERGWQFEIGTRIEF